jgi:hypothetical protein
LTLRMRVKQCDRQGHQHHCMPASTLAAAVSRASGSAAGHSNGAEWYERPPCPPLWGGLAGLCHWVTYNA